MFYALDESKFILAARLGQAALNPFIWLAHYGLVADLVAYALQETKNIVLN